MIAYFVALDSQCSMKSIKMFRVLRSPYDMWRFAFRMNIPSAENIPLVRHNRDVNQLKHLSIFERSLRSLIPREKKLYKNIT